MDVRTDGHVTITSLTKFFGLIGYQISLAMELRLRASALAPLKSDLTRPFCPSADMSFLGKCQVCISYIED